MTLGILVACNSSAEVDPEMEVSSDTIDKLKEAQDENIELEAIDGELDSLITAIN